MNKDNGFTFKNVISFVAIASIPVLIATGLFFGRQELSNAPKPKEIEPMTTEQKGETPDKIITMEEAEEAPEEVEAPDESELSEGQKVAEDFIAAFHTFDVTEPTGYLEAAAPFMTEDMANKYTDIPKRGAGGVIRENVVEMEVLPSHLEGDNQVWRIGTTGEAESDAGKEYTFTEYQVLVIRDGANWKVNGVTANGN